MNDTDTLFLSKIVDNNNSHAVFLAKSLNSSTPWFTIVWLCLWCVIAILWAGVRLVHCLLAVEGLLQ